MSDVFLNPQDGRNNIGQHDARRYDMTQSQSLAVDCWPAMNGCHSHIQRAVLVDLSNHKASVRLLASMHVFIMEIASHPLGGTLP
jgi:poly(3-hydroxybutyrate) depolymerase